MPERLGDRVRRVRLGPLDPSSVEALAAAAGLPAHGEQVMARTAGHTLSVVEYLRALGEGDTGVPPRSPTAVLARVARLDAEGRSVVEAGAVLRRRIDPRLLAALAESSEVATPTGARSWPACGCSSAAATTTSSPTTSSRSACTPRCRRPSRSPYHRRAADLTSDRPEVMAEHAHAVGDEPARPTAGCSPARRRCAGRPSRTRSGCS